MGVASSDREEVVPPSPFFYFRALANRLAGPFRRSPRLRRKAGQLVFLAPAVVFLLMFIAFPVLATLFLSVGLQLNLGAVLSGNPADVLTGEITAEHYDFVLTHRDTFNLDGFPKWPPLGTVAHNAIWIAIHLPLTMFTGLALALILRDVKGASVVKAAIFIGMVTPMIVGGIILRFLYTGGVGIVPAFFEAIGVEALSGSWMSRPETVLFALVFGSVWLWTGFSLIVYSAGLTTIPKEYFEAAKVDGASSFRVFTRIVFPLLKPITLVVVTMTVLWNLKIFDIVFAATNPSGGVGQAADVLAIQMFRYTFLTSNFEIGFARGAAVAALLTLLTLVATAWLVRRLSRR